MNIVQALKERVIGNKRTTLGGGGVGIVFAGIVTGYLVEAGCDMSKLAWAPFLTYLGPQVVGAFTTDKTMVTEPQKENA